MSNYAKKGEMSNAEYAKTNTHFLACCEKANAKPTARQASKFRNGYGEAYKIHEAIKAGNK